MARKKSKDEVPLYNRLAALRVDRGLTRQDLAKEVGVHVQTIGYLERGEYNPSLLMAMKLARLFELPVEAVFSLEPLQSMSEQLYTPTRQGETELGPRN